MIDAGPASAAAGHAERHRPGAGRPGGRPLRGRVRPGAPPVAIPHPLRSGRAPARPDGWRDPDLPRLSRLSGRPRPRLGSCRTRGTAPPRRRPTGRSAASRKGPTRRTARRDPPLRSGRAPARPDGWRDPDLPRLSRLSGRPRPRLGSCRTRGTTPPRRRPTGRSAASRKGPTRRTARRDPPPSSKRPSSCSAGRLARSRSAALVPPQWSTQAPPRQLPDARNGTAPAPADREVGRFEEESEPGAPPVAIPHPLRSGRAPARPDGWRDPDLPRLSRLSGRPRPRLGSCRTRGTAPPRRRPTGRSAASRKGPTRRTARRDPPLRSGRAPARPDGWRDPDLPRLSRLSGRPRPRLGSCRTRGTTPPRRRPTGRSAASRKGPTRRTARRDPPPSSKRPSSCSAGRLARSRSAALVPPQWSTQAPPRQLPDARNGTAPAPADREVGRFEEESEPGAPPVAIPHPLRSGRAPARPDGWRDPDLPRLSRLSGRPRPASAAAGHAERRRPGAGRPGGRPLRGRVRPGAPPVAIPHPLRSGRAPARPDGWRDPDLPRLSRLSGRPRPRLGSCRTRGTTPPGAG
jgi:hypothetical protein